MSPDGATARKPLPNTCGSSFPSKHVTCTGAPWCGGSSSLCLIGQNKRSLILSILSEKLPAIRLVNLLIGAYRRSNIIYLRSDDPDGPSRSHRPQGQVDRRGTC